VPLPPLRRMCDLVQDLSLAACDEGAVREKEGARRESPGRQRRENLPDRREKKGGLLWHARVIWYYGLHRVYAWA
jgi:hypothetical protein